MNAETREVRNGAGQISPADEPRYVLVPISHGTRGSLLLLNRNCTQSERGGWSLEGFGARRQRRQKP